MPRLKSVSVGDRSGKILATSVQPSPRPGKHCRVTILCDCGTVKEMSSQIFRKSKSCGCERNNSSTWKRFGALNMPWKLPDGEASKRGFIYFVRVSASRRQIDCALEDDDIISLASSNCDYCGAPPSRHFKQNPASNGAFVCNGIDRVDNSLGYVKGNVVACCTHCNMMKRALSKEVFLSHVLKIASFQKEAAPVTAAAFEQEQGK